MEMQWKRWNTRRCVTLNDVSAGDKIVAYMGLIQKKPTKFISFIKGHREHRTIQQILEMQPVNGMNLLHSTVDSIRFMLEVRQM